MQLHTIQRSHLASGQRGACSQAACWPAAARRDGYTALGLSSALPLPGAVSKQACVFHSLPRRSTPQHTAAAASSSGAATSSGSTSNGGAAVMVWFKSDLRVDDHEGLVQAVKAAGSSGRVVPLYCLDPALLHHLAFLPAGPEVLAGALLELRDALRGAGSDLVVVRGRWQDAVPDAARRFGATSVYAQQEVEHMLWQPAQDVASKLSAAGVSVQWWDTLIWPDNAFKHNFRDWRTRRPEAQPPLAAPSQLPALPDTCQDTGAVPGAEEIRELLAKDPPTHLHAEAAMRREVQPVLAAMRDGPKARRQQALIARGRDWLQRLAVYLTLRDSVITAAQAIVRKSSALAAASISLSSTDVSDTEGAETSGTTEQQLTAIMEGAVKDAEFPGAPGASFPEVFAVALALGALSRRRVWHEAQRTSSSSGSGPSSLAAKAAAQAAESADFHWQLSLRNDKRPEVPEGVQFRHWRWNGFITDYMVAEPAQGKALPEDAPAILLLHGFGAFGDQWRDNLVELAEAGYRVYAPTLPGFGRSEKPAVSYSQLLWGNFLRDFVVQVVGRQVVLAGNSIGGFIATSTAADHPTLVRGLVLLNSAGPIDGKPFSMEKWQLDADARKPPPAWVARAVSGGLFWYLERTVPQQLSWLYPTAPHRAKGWLADEIVRAASDIGAVEVFGSVFYLPPPRPLNWLLKERYKGPTLVLQGVLDPLNDAKGRAYQLQTLVGKEQVEVKEVQAGHCPHDEVPHEVNQGLREWVERVVWNPATASQGGKDEASAAAAVSATVRGK